MKIITTLLLVALLFSCTGKKDQPQEDLLPEKKLTKLEQLEIA